MNTGIASKTGNTETVADYPRITIVTPSYQQAQYLEQTIDSVLSQGYPNLEYIVIDGGSTDGSVDIIKRHEKHLAYWVSEKDKGQTHAINKGMERATGSILAYINSDDFYLPGALSLVADLFIADPDLDLVYGRCRFVDEAGNKIGEHLGSINNFENIVDLWGVWWNKLQIIQPEAFWSRRIADRVGPFHEDLFFVMDFEYWTRIFRAEGKVGKIDTEVASFRFTPHQKTKRVEEVRDELLRVVQKLLWDNTAPISASRRFALQGKWLFDEVFRKQADRSVAGGDSRTLRWLRLLGLSLRHPQLLFSSSFRDHLSANLKKL